MESKKCVHCGICTQNCLFLQKYGMDIGEIQSHPELAYHCFLCGRCTQVCPLGIDGRERILSMRQEQVQKNNGKLPEKGYGALLWEKRNYRFANYHTAAGSCVLFPGCNFPSFYPKATRQISRLLKEKAGIGTVFDCCGKPLAELGLSQQDSIQALEQRLMEKGIKQLVMLCPNCYHFLKPRLHISVVSIYEKLTELGLGKVIYEPILLFPPCPDRASRELLGHIRPFLASEPDVFEQIQCCGLGGCAGGKEAKLAQQMGQQAAEASLKSGRRLMTYCASCAGNFVRNGCPDTGHILLRILEIQEQPQIKMSVINRAKTKYWRG